MPGPTSLKNLSLSPAAATLGLGNAQTPDQAALDDELEKKKKALVAQSGGLNSPAITALLGGSLGGIGV